MSDQIKKPWDDLSGDLESLKRENDFIDFSTLNTLRMATRSWFGKDREGRINKGLAVCVEKRRRPYALIGYFLAPVRISANANEANDMVLLEDKPVYPNYILFVGIKEQFCSGEWINRYEEGFPPFIIKAQAVKPLLNPIRRALSEAKEYGLHPWLLEYFGAQPQRLFNRRNMFEVGALRKLPKIQELPEYLKLKTFKALLEKYGLKHPNSVISITPDNFDRAYKEAFKEEIEAWFFARQKLDEPIIEEAEEDYNENDSWDYGF